MTAFDSRSVLRNLGGLVLALVIAGTASVVAGQDANWDLGNYHLYNPWAWLNGRYGLDLAPAQLQTFHNPLVDIPFYAMVASDWPPRWIAFAMGLPAGIGGFALWKLAEVLVPALEPRERTIAVLAAALIGLSGVAGIAMLGTTMNEWPGAALVIVAVWLIARDLVGARDTAGAGLPSPPSSRIGIVALAGALTGLACGLKLTAATFAAGIAIALLVRRPLRQSIRDATVFGIAVLAGAAIMSAHWMALLQAHYESPLFPYFNQWFRSPLYPPEPAVVRAFGPHTLTQWITFPFDLLRPRQGYVAELRHRDARFPLLATLALAAIAATAIRHRAASATHDPALAAAWRFIAVFFVASFVIWTALHSIYRYLLPLELVSGIAIVALLLRLTRARWRVLVLVATTLVLVLTTRYPTWGRTQFGEHFVDVGVPPIERGALVILTGDEPMSHVLVRFPPDARHIGIANNLSKPGMTTGLDVKLRAIVASHRGPVYQLTPLPLSHDDALAGYGLARVADRCAPVTSNLSRQRLMLCKLARTGEPR